jgi:hypothetical protein
VDHSGVQVNKYVSGSGRISGSGWLRNGKLILDFFIPFSYNIELEIKSENS